MFNKILKILSLDKTGFTLWMISLGAVVGAFFFTSGNDFLSLLGTIIGVTSLIYLAKGYVIGQVLIIIFSLFYAVVSYKNQYYGEMITYLFMTAPMAFIALIQWMKNPYGETNEVKVRSKLTTGHTIFLIISSILVTAIFYFILKVLGNASLLVSTLSITTSYVAAYLTAARVPYYALGYALNDVVLIILWVAASIKSSENIPLLVNFSVFLMNDLYGFISCKKMEKRQKNI